MEESSVVSWVLTAGGQSPWWSPAGAAGGPEVGLALRGGSEIGAVEFVEAGFGELELGLGGGGAELVGAELGQQMADEGSG